MANSKDNKNTVNKQQVSTKKPEKQTNTLVADKKKTEVKTVVDSNTLPKEKATAVSKAPTQISETKAKPGKNTEKTPVVAPTQIIDEKPVESIVNDEKESKAPKKTTKKKKALEGEQLVLDLEDTPTINEPIVKEDDVKVSEALATEDVKLETSVDVKDCEVLDEKVEVEKDEKSVQKVKAPKPPKKSKAYLKSPLVRVETTPDLGLNDKQVEERFDKGFSNAMPNIVTKSYFSIFRSNIFTLFNIINIVLASLVFIFGNFKNALFIFIVAANAVIGLFQEIRSKRTLEKMSLLTAPTITVVRNGEHLQIPTGEIVLDDIIILKTGAQVPADCIVVKGNCEANESLLTGEQDDIPKHEGSELLSGSTIPAGEVYCRVTAVGHNSYSSKLLTEAKKFKKPKSELMKSINWIIRIVTILIFPIGVMMFFNNYEIYNHEMGQTVTSTVASIVGMIPEGLIALTSVALAAGVYKLSKKKTLVQELYSIETLARVDVLCLDKTGTITEGSMQVEQVHVYSSKFGFIDDIMANMVKSLGSDGSTFAAFSEYFHTNEEYDTVKTIPFSSSRKWSAVDFGAKGKFVVGAPEFVLKDKFYLVENDAKEYTSQGYRVLVLARTTEQLSENLDVEKLKPISLIVLSDKIRESAGQTFEYFAKQGVALKVISGDNPITVSKVAERAGLIGAEKFIDASVDLLTTEQIYDACDKYTIFGRVSPKQKKLLVQALKSKGYTVGMTGDGVNDVMALKEADCSIAMASGSDAARNVAQLVLLDSDFASLPSVVAEGRRVINNIERASSLFLVKTTFSATLSILMVLFSLNYPFQPIQLTLISTLFVGLPSFFLALEPNDTKVTGSFLGKVFKKALPAGLTIALMIFLISYTYRDIGINVTQQISTMACYTYAVVSFVVLLQVCLPFNKERLFLVVLSLMAFIMAVTIDFTREIFGLVTLTSNMSLKTFIIIMCIVPTVAFMRVEIEAIKTLIGNMVNFVKKSYGKAKKVLNNINQEKK